MRKFKTIAVAAAALMAAAAGQAHAAEVFAGVYGHDVTFIGNALGVSAAGSRGQRRHHAGRPLRPDPVAGLAVEAAGPPVRLDQHRRDLELRRRRPVLADQARRALLFPAPASAWP